MPRRITLLSSFPPQASKTQQSVDAPFSPQSRLCGDPDCTCLSRFGSINSSVILSMSAIILSSVSGEILPSQATQSSSNLSLKEKNTSGKTALGIYPNARWRRYSDTESPHFSAFSSMIFFLFLTYTDKQISVLNFIHYISPFFDF